MMELDLKAHRCPTAQVLMNRILDLFINSEECDLVIKSIEPSLGRNIKARIAALDLNVVIDSIEQSAISQKDIENWLCDFDDDDFGDVTIITQFTIAKTG